MTKQETIVEILIKIYNSKSNLIISNQEIKNINIFYKEHYEDDISFTDFLFKDIKIANSIIKMQSGKYEIEKQFKNKMALQSGILTECIYAQTLANILGLEKCIDLDAITFNQIPSICKNFIEHLKPSKYYLSSARYLYYSSQKDNEFIIQYGNPTSNDTDIVYYNEELHLEIKDTKSKAGEYDLCIDKNGKLLITDLISNRYNDL